MLRDWKASAGCIQTGINKGKPMRLLKVQPNSLAILTTRNLYDTDDKRFIFAVFLVDENFGGDARELGYVTTNSKWKIELTPQESHKMLFWNYYVNENAPEKVVFGSHRIDFEEVATVFYDDAIMFDAPEHSSSRLARFLHNFVL